MKAALLCLALIACGASARENTLKVALVTADAARAAFMSYDAHHQLDIVDADKASGKTLDRAQADLAAYRKARVPVVEALETSYRALAAAAVLEDDPKNLDNLKAALGILADALHALGVR